jgi:uncharacterized protein (DUF362 family)
MADTLSNHTFAPKVGIAQLPSPSYPDGPESDNPVSQALSRLADTLGWSNERGPFGNVIPKGARVLIKPNLVLHQNEGVSGLDCLVTHASVIRAAVEAALRTDAAEVLVGDAPIQGCDFDAMVEGMGLRSWAREQSARDQRFKGPQDFRRTTGVLVHGVRVASENLQPIERFTLFNLGRESVLEPISNGEERFRVAWYDHRLLAKTHYPGVHQYLVAREVVEADVIINLPKLKLHRKAGITCALKNLIGINGNKEYLPHHRLGGSQGGGDNYPGNSPVKRALEYVRDRQNITTSRAASQGLSLLAAVLARTARGLGDHFGADGSWSGNDTVWRTCLDLNRILLYGRSDGTMSDEIQRRVLHIADAVVAGQGNGPLAPDPLALGIILGGNNAAAVDWVGAHLLALDPEKVPLARHAFDQFRWPITNSSSGSVRVGGDLGDGLPLSVVEKVRQPVNLPLGWRAAAAVQQSRSDASRQELAPAGSSVSPWDA